MAVVFPALRPLAISHWPPRLRVQPSHRQDLRHVGKVSPVVLPLRCGSASPAPASCSSLPASHGVFLAFFRPASRQLHRFSVSRLPGVGGCSRCMVVSSLEGCFPHLLLGSSDLTCSGETARAGPGALARATWQPGGPAPSLAPGPHGGHRLLFGRGWPPRASGPGPALSVLGGAGSGR